MAPQSTRPVAALLLQLATSSALLSAAPQPFASTRLEPEITFSLDEEPRGPDHDADRVDEADGLDGWRVLARKAAGLQQLECTDNMLGATGRMVDEAERGDTLAMAALGVMCMRPTHQHTKSCPCSSAPDADTARVPPPCRAQTSSGSNARPSATSRGGSTG